LQGLVRPTCTNGKSVAIDQTITDTRKVKVQQQWIDTGWLPPCFIPARSLILKLLQNQQFVVNGPVLVNISAWSSQNNEPPLINFLLFKLGSLGSKA
jgi:hypothetical protein